MTITTSKLVDTMAERGITCGELSKRVGISMPNLSRMRTGKTRAIRFSTLEALCRELQCQPGDIIGPYEEGRQQR